MALAPLARALAARFVVTAAVTALAAATLVTVAALVEGHAPRPDALTAVAPLAGIVGAAWTLGGWRSSAEDVALAGLGVAPGVVAAGLAVLAAPLLWVGGASRPPALDLELAPGEVRLVGAGPPTRWRWVEGGVALDEPSAAGPVMHATLPPLPPPTTRSTPPTPGLPVGLPRLALVAALLGWLAARREAPGPALVLSGATIVFVGSQLLARLL